MAEDRKRGKRADDASEEASSQQGPKWGLVTYRVKFVFLNLYQCRSDMAYTDIEEAETAAEELSQFGGLISLVRVSAERDKVYGEV